MTFFAQALLAALITMVMVLWLRRPASRFGLLDHPGGRKRHGAAVPLTGGIAMVVGFFAALALSFDSLATYKVLLVAFLLLGVVGVLDDVGELSPRSKLGAQLIAAVLMTSWAGLFLLTLGDIFGRGPIELKHWGIPLTVFAVIAVINSINMLDGADGLAGGLVFVILASFAALAYFVTLDVNATKLLLVMAGAVAGFLFFNAPFPWRRDKHRIFMGDAGSMALGYAIAWFSVDLTQRPERAVAPVLMLWIIAIPLLDLFTVTVRRIIKRRDPALPDRGHVHHLLMRKGWSAARVGTLLIAIQAALAASGVALWLAGVPQWLLFAGFVLVGVVFVTLFLFPGWWLIRRRPRRADQSS